MADELQGLIDRIKTEAVGAGEKQATELVAQARTKAAAIVREAEDKARATLEKADQDARQFAERGRQTLTQASRDLLISVGRGVENILSDLADTAVGAALAPDTMAEMLVKLAGAYARQGGRESRIEVLLSEKDRQQLVDLMKQKYHQQLGQGLTLHADNNVFSGFKVRLQGESVLHDFTREAIAEALSNFLRPHLAEIVTRATQAGGPAEKA